MSDEGKKWDTLIRATKLEREELIEIGQLKGYMGLYTVGLEHIHSTHRCGNQTIQCRNQAVGE